MIKVEQLELCILSICRNVVNDTLIVDEKREKIEAEIQEISLDGKAIRSTNSHGNPEKALQIVTAYDVNNKMPVAQTEIKDKTNEITAGRDILEMFEVENAIITADAMHWILDVNFREDDCPVKSENTQRILNVMRKLSIKLHTDYIEKTKPKRKTIISSIRAYLTNNQNLKIF